MKILVLCTGNSCRSQMAHGFLENMNNNNIVFSAGTKPAKEINSIAAAVMKEIGIDISDNTTNNADEYINEGWDYLITVCNSAKELCPNFTGLVTHKLHHSFDDPYEIRGADEFVFNEYRRVRDEIKEYLLELKLIIDR